MSSIYRKGRDGYFYYQKYLKNPNTGKKDKKIFHSLGTKDRNVAIQKQIEFDLMYEKKSSFLKHIKGSHYLIGTLISLLVIVTYMKYGSRQHIKNPTIIRDDISETLEVTRSVNDLDSGGNQDSIKTISLLTKEDDALTTSAPETKVLENFNSIPTYSVIREEKIDNNFRQIKIHISVNRNTKRNDLFLLSKSIKENYFDFLNIIVCFYSDDLEGEKMARDGMQSFNALQKQNLWLAMYSYNKVEGEYFNDNPAGYLGAY